LRGNSSLNAFPGLPGHVITTAVTRNRGTWRVQVVTQQQDSCGKRSCHAFWYQDNAVALETMTELQSIRISGRAVVVVTIGKSTINLITNPHSVSSHSITWRRRRRRQQQQHHHHHYYYYYLFTIVPSTARPRTLPQAQWRKHELPSFTSYT
jgi:hypothetical protein